MSLLDLDDVDAPLNPSPSWESSDSMGHVSTNPAASFLEDPSTVVLANSYSGVSSGTAYATMPRASTMGGGGASGVDVSGDNSGTTPVKHSKLTKFIAHRRKASKGSIMKKGGNSPPLSPKVMTSSPEQAKKKHRYSTLRDEADSASNFNLGRESPDHLDPSTGAVMFPLSAEATTPLRGSTSSAGDIGSELSSPVGASTAVGSSSTTTMLPAGLVRPPRQGQPSVAISQAVASGFVPAQPMVSPWVTSQPQANSKANSILVPTPVPISQQPVSQLPANSPWTSQTPVAAGKESSTVAANPGQQGSDSDWIISDEMRQKLVAQFWDLSPENGLLKGEKARSFFVKSKLPNHELSHIWKLSDIDEDNSLSEEEFCIAMKLVVARRKGLVIPAVLPEVLRPHPQPAPGPKGAEQAGPKTQSPPTIVDWAKFPSNGSPPSAVEAPADNEPNVVLPPPPSHGKRSARGSKQEGSTGMPPSRSFDDVLLTGVDPESEVGDTSTAQKANLSGEHSSGAPETRGDTEQVNIDESGGGGLKCSSAETSSESAARSLNMASTGQLVELEPNVATADSPVSKEGSPVVLHSEEEEEEGEDEKSALYTAVNKAWKTPKKKSSKLNQVGSPSPTTEDSSEGRASACSGAEMEHIDSAVVTGRSSQAKFNPPVVKPKPRRPPPPLPVPFAEHVKKLSSSPAHAGKSEVPPHTRSLVELEPDVNMYEVVENKDPTAQPGRTTPGKLASAAYKHSNRDKPPVSAKPEKLGGVKLPGPEKKGVAQGVSTDEIKATLMGLKARGHQRTASLDSKKEELATSREYQSLIEGLPPANPPALPPKPRKRGNFLEEPARQTASGSAGRKISRSASMDSISSLSSLSSHPGTTTSPAPLQRTEEKTSPQGSPKVKKKPLPLPSTKLPIHPSRVTADLPKSSSRPAATSAEPSNAPTSHPHPQPVAPGDKQFRRVLKELQSLKSSSTHSGPDSAHPTAPAPHGADVLSVAIAIAEKASVLPSSSQHKSVLRDKAVVQGAIKMLQEEVGALKSTNMELQNQLCLLVEERNRLRARARAAAAKR